MLPRDQARGVSSSVGANTRKFVVTCGAASGVAAACRVQGRGRGGVGFRLWGHPYFGRALQRIGRVPQAQAVYRDQAHFAEFQPPTQRRGNRQRQAHHLSRS